MSRNTFAARTKPRSAFDYRFGRLLRRAGVRYRVISAPCPGGRLAVPLMTRFFLFSCPALAVYIHLFHRSDVDEWHDHPWPFVSFLWHRGYWENTPSGRKWRRRFSVLPRRAEYRHFVEVAEPTWTIVIRLRRWRDWGFWVAGKWIRWDLFTSSGQRGICNEVESE